MLASLLSHSRGTGLSPSVVSLTDVGAIGRALLADDVPVRALGMDKHRPNVLEVLRLAEWIHAERPDIVQTWMYHADLVGGLAARMAGHIPVIWGVHHSDLTADAMKRSTASVARLCGILSSTVPRRIVYVSRAGAEAHERFGYAREKTLVIPNGFDSSVFRASDMVRGRVRAQLNIPPDMLCVGMVARFAPVKDHLTFLTAFSALKRRYGRVRAVLCGQDVDSPNTMLTGWLCDLGLTDSVNLLGLRDDVQSLYPAFDVFCSSSRSEAFPLAVGEAMASEVPCVVTDVGDSATLVGDTGVVVRRGDAASLAEGLGCLLCRSADERRALGRAARRRIQEHYSLQATVQAYELLYSEVLGESGL